MRSKNRFFVVIIQSVLFFDATNQSQVKQTIATLKTIRKTVKSPMFKTIGNTIKKPIIKTFGNTMKNSVGMFSLNKNTIKNVAFGMKEKYMQSGVIFRNKAMKYLGGRQFVQSKNQLPLLFGGGLMRTQFNLSPDPTLDMKLNQPVELEKEVEDMSMKDMNKSRFKSKLDELLSKMPSLKKATPDDDPAHKVVDDERLTKKGKDGKIKFDDCTYEGELEEGGTMAGKLKGKLTFNDKSEYNGEFLDGEFHGTGKLMRLDGQVYEGEFLNGHFHGKGKQLNAEGNIYSGNFVEGAMSGNGAFLYADKAVYDGEFLNGMYEGKGVLKYPSGNFYDGGFKMNKRSGYGEYYFYHGCYYKGDWLNDQYHGKGEQYRHFNNSTEEGEFKNGVFVDGPKKVAEEDGKPIDFNDAKSKL